MTARLSRRTGFPAALAVAAMLAFAPRPAAGHEPIGPALAEAGRRMLAEPGNAFLPLARADLRRLARDFEGAEDDLRRAALLGAPARDLRLATARLALDRGEPAGALAALEAPAGGPVEAAAHALRARALTALGRTAEAIDAWSAAIAASEQPEPDDYYARARLQLAAGRREDARAGLRAGVGRLGAAASLEAALAALGDARAPGPTPAIRPAAGPASGLFAPPVPLRLAATAIARGPYLQRMAPGEVTVRWRTTTSTDGRVWYGPAPGVYSGAADDPANGTEHVVRITGLTAGTRYWYAVGPTSGWIAGGDSLTFVTSPAPGATGPVRIWAIGDSGLPGADQNRVRDAFLAWTGTRGTDVWLMLGDNAYNSGLDSEYQGGLFTPYRALLQKWTLWPTRGNHDAVYSGANNDYYDFFTLPAAAEAGGTASGSEAYYSYDHGSVHFVCLDSEGSDRSPGSPMLTWLAADLAANTRPWTIAYFHHPPYTKGSHDSDNDADSGGRMRDMRVNALPVLEAGGVDLVLTGHSHSYERSYLLDGHYGKSPTLTDAMKKSAGDGRVDGDGPYGKHTLGPAPHEGAVYAVAGSSARIEAGPLNHPAMVFSLEALGSMVIDVDGARLDARFLSDTGVVRDSFTILKGAVTAVGDGDRRGPELGPALPNPFRRDVSLRFRLAEPAVVTLAVFDAEGRRVATLAHGAFAAGEHPVRWEGLDAAGRKLAPGVYLASLEAGGRRVTRRIALVH